LCDVKLDDAESSRPAVRQGYLCERRLGATGLVGHHTLKPRRVAALQATSAAAAVVKDCLSGVEPAVTAV
jgi:hypothetical protein